MSHETYMYWRRNVEALTLQLLTFVVIGLCWPNKWVMVTAVIPMVYAVIHAATVSGETRGWLVDGLIFVVTNRATLTVLAGLCWVIQRLWFGRRRGQLP